MSALYLLLTCKYEKIIIHNNKYDLWLRRNWKNIYTYILVEAKSHNGGKVYERN